MISLAFTPPDRKIGQGNHCMHAFSKVMCTRRSSCVGWNEKQMSLEDWRGKLPWLVAKKWGTDNPHNHRRRPKRYRVDKSLFGPTDFGCMIFVSVRYPRSATRA